MDREDVPVDKVGKYQVMTLEEKRHQMTMEGLRDIADGRVIDSDEITAWINSLRPQCPLVLLQPKR